MTKRILLYVFGMILTGLSVNLILLSDIGAGGWDAVTYNLSVWTTLSLGTISALINGTIMLLIILVRQKLKYLWMFIPIFGIALSIDFWDVIVFDAFMKPNFIASLIIFIAGGLLLPFSLVLIVLSKFPAMVFEELTFVLMHILKMKSFLVTRLIIEGTAFVLAFVFGMAAGIGLGALNIGTLVISISIGPIMTFYLRLFKH
jgi:uncharacterized protein